MTPRAQLTKPSWRSSIVVHPVGPDRARTPCHCMGGSWPPRAEPWPHRSSPRSRADAARLRDRTRTVVATHGNDDDPGWRPLPGTHRTSDQPDQQTPNQPTNPVVDQGRFQVSWQDNHSVWHQRHRGPKTVNVVFPGQFRHDVRTAYDPAIATTLERAGGLGRNSPTRDHPAKPAPFQPPTHPGTSPYPVLLSSGIRRSFPLICNSIRAGCRRPRHPQETHRVYLRQHQRPKTQDTWLNC
jgi:hypothetical protein